jgi:hypothetical protein
MNQNDYFIEERKGDYGVVSVKYIPKESDCEFCNVKHSTNKMKVLYYRDKDEYRRKKHLCLYCYKLLAKLI